MYTESVEDGSSIADYNEYMNSMNGGSVSRVISPINSD